MMSISSIFRLALRRRAWAGSLLLLCVLLLSVTSSDAYNRYNDGCQNCHGAFSDGTSPRGSVFPGDNKHQMHRSASAMNADCGLCHTSGDGRNPFIGSSDGTNSNPGLGCTGCHKPEGLRLHHVNNNITSCQNSNCHNDTTPDPENVLPAYYGLLVDSSADEPCNAVAEANINENWTIGDFLGLDNDGDLLYDANDPDCMVAGGECGDGTVDPGEQCDDGNTADGDCCSSTCQYEPSGSTCSNGLFCAVDETCDGAGSCGGGSLRDCSDGVSCTSDACDEDLDTCLNTPNDAVCDDGQFCNGDEVCDPVSDCQPGTPVDCNDGDICTDDSCNEGLDRCDNIFNPGNDPSCAPNSCGNGQVDPGEDCDDGNNLDGDCCAADCTFEPEDSVCDDGLFCSVGTACDGAGTCGGGVSRDCTDGVTCTVDTCNEAAGACENIPDDTICDDGLFCNGPETCSAINDCQDGAPVNCDDGDECTTDSCSEADTRCDNIFDAGNAPGCFERCLDQDADGFSPDGNGCGPLDCDDGDATVNPGAEEVCTDDRDNDCNGLIDAADPACEFTGTPAVRKGPLADPAYAGSTTCARCHASQFESWQGTLHARMTIRPGDAQAAGFPLPTAESLPGASVALQSWSDVQFVIGQKWKTRWVDRSGQVQGIQWNLLLGEWASYSGGSYDCGSCHMTGFNADEPFVNEKGETVPGFNGSWVEYNIGCEACHGPGAAHAAAPARDNINQITLDWTDTGEGIRTPGIRSSEVCGQCHFRGSTHEGIVDSARRSRSQFNDWSAGPHASSLESTSLNTYCAKCHSPGNAEQGAEEQSFKAFDPKDATHVACITCHNPHETSHPRWETLEWPSTSQDPARYPAALARYLGTDGSSKTSDYLPFPNTASNALCADCHKTQPGLRRHLEAAPPAVVSLAPPFNSDKLVEVPHAFHVEQGIAECVDCHMARTRTSINANDQRTHAMVPNERAVGGYAHYDASCGSSSCHDGSGSAPDFTDCVFCHSSFGAAGIDSMEEVRRGRNLLKPEEDRRSGGRRPAGSDRR